MHGGMTIKVYFPALHSSFVVAVLFILQAIYTQVDPLEMSVVSTELILALLPQARETLAEIPDQFLSYMKTHGIRPNPPPLKKQQSGYINPPGGPPQAGINYPSQAMACTCTLKDMHDYSNCCPSLPCCPL